MGKSADQVPKRKVKEKTMNRPKIAKIAAISAIALVTLVSVGCANEPKVAANDLPVASISVSCDEFSADQGISKEIQVSAGSSVTVTLCSNPTTGFQWGQAQIADPTVAAEADHKFVEPNQSVDGQLLMGAPGQDVWTFKALKKGSTTISMDYSRPWEGGEKAEWTFNLTITVK
jgi:inhibitor of cysteine peptidase